MRGKLYLSALLAFAISLAHAQNKTLGVGTTTPNPNAALHVEAPANNQGFLMPRLTTAQRTAPGFIGVLTTTDAGLMVYDTDLQDVYIWDGTAWGPAASGISLPASNTLTNTDLLNDSDALSIVYTGDSARTLLNLDFANASNPNITNPFVLTHRGQGAALNLQQTGTLGTGGVFIVTNPVNSQPAVRGTTNGTGNSGTFIINNAASFSFAVYGQNNGDSTGAAVHGNNTGNGFGVFGKSAGSKFASAAVYGEHVGTGDAAGAFRISNTSNTYSALFGETNGSGAAVFGNQIGLGRAGQFQITNAANANAAVRGYTDGTGNSGLFTISNPANTSAGILSTTDGSGPALEARQIGTGNGLVANSDNGSGILALSNSVAGPALEAYKISGGGNSIVAGHNGANANGPGNAIYAFVDDGNSTGIRSEIQSPTGTGSALSATTSSGANSFAADFTITNASNTYPVVQGNNQAGSGSVFRAFQNGTGAGVDVFMQNVSSTAHGIFVDQQGLGNAGNFQNTNSANNLTALLGATNSPTGTAIEASHTANGSALAISSGGMKITVLDVTVTSITTRAAAYRITSGGTTFSLDFSPTDGEVFLVYNETGSAITVNPGSVAIPANEGRTLVVFAGGAIRGF